MSKPRGKWTSNTTAVASFVLGGIALVAAGIYRLQIAQPPERMLTKTAALTLADACLPRIMVPTASAITVAPISPASATTFAITTTGPVEVHLPGPTAAPGTKIDLKDKDIVLAKRDGLFEFKLQQTDGVLVRRPESTLRLHAPARFGPADDSTYAIKVTQAVTATVDPNGKTVVAAGQELGKMPIGIAQSLVPLHPLSASMWVANAPGTLQPLRVSGQPGLADLSIEVSRSGLRTEPSGGPLIACAARMSASSEPGGWNPAGLTQAAAGTGSAGKVVLALSASESPADMDWLSPIWIVVASSDGRTVAFGSAQFVGRLWGALGATLLTGILLATIMRARGIRTKTANNTSRWFAGLFIGADNAPSLSLLQIFVWTTITIWGFFYVFIVAGNLLALTPEMLGLLGIAGAGTVLARWISSSGGGTQQSAAPQPAAAPGSTPGGNDFWQMMSTGGNFDLLKLQLFSFTVVIALYVIWRIADAAAFPALDTGTLLLMGVSQGVYVTSKLAGTTDLAGLQAIKVQLDLNAAEKKLLEAKKAVIDARWAGFAAGAVPAALQTELTDVTQQISANAARATALQADYDKGLAALGLKKL